MDKRLRDRLLSLLDEYDKLQRLLASPEVATDPSTAVKYAKALSDLEPLVTCYRRYAKTEADLEQARTLLEDETHPELREMAETEIENCELELERLEQELKVLLLPRDPNDEKNIIMEIRAGTGGEEAALFAADLFRMYTRYAERQGWRVELMDTHPTGLGGYKEVVFRVVGQGAYSRLKFEGGVHRVQRVPETEAQGRIHTSAVTVAVLPEAEEIDVQIDPQDLQIDVYRSSGAGGQHVNTTDSAVRITHKPTGIVVTCQDERSQHKNKARALMILRAKLLQVKQEEEMAQRSQTRRIQVGSGDRSERIRTYNFPQNRVTDHRINLTLYHLDRVLEGELDDLVEALIAADRATKLLEFTSAVTQ